jgi:hypothetical protein
LVTSLRRVSSSATSDAFARIWCNGAGLSTAAGSRRQRFWPLVRLDRDWCDFRVRSNERINDKWIVSNRSAFAKDSKSVLSTQARSIGSIRSKSIKTIDNGKNARTQRYVGSRNPSRIACTVPMFMVMSHDRNHGIRELAGRKKISTNFCVTLYFSNSAGVNCPGLLRMCSGIASLPMS